MMHLIILFWLQCCLMFYCLEIPNYAALYFRKERFMFVSFSHYEFNAFYSVAMTACVTLKLISYY